MGDVFRAPVRVPQGAGAAVSEPALAAVAGSGRHGSQFQARGFHARTPGAALPAGTQGRIGPAQRPAPMRLWRAHHDGRRDGGGREASGCPIRKRRHAIPPATSTPSARRWPGCSAAASPARDGKLQLLGQNAVLNFFAREFPKLQTRVERFARGTAGTQHGAEPRTHRTAVSISPRACNGSILGWCSLRAAARRFRRRTFSACCCPAKATRA